ncbi:MAG: hypothetical protein GEU95_23310 [Rhizobiales bacterium]|nr:hypothetical protein [Hyphomicrobiales bacterium]
MADETEPKGSTPANDNRRADGNVDIALCRRLDQAALSLARLIGRQIAREQFDAMQAANDNRPHLRMREAVAAEDQDQEGEQG